MPCLVAYQTSAYSTKRRKEKDFVTDKQGAPLFLQTVTHVTQLTVTGDDTDLIRLSLSVSGSGPIRSACLHKSSFSYSAIYCYGEVLTQIFFFFGFFKDMTRSQKEKETLNLWTFKGSFYSLCVSTAMSQMCTLLNTAHVWWAPVAQVLRSSYLWPDASVWHTFDVNWTFSKAKAGFKKKKMANVSKMSSFLSHISEFVLALLL